MRILKGLWHDEDGLTTVEYALLLLVLILGATTIWVGLGGRVGNAVARANRETEGASGR